MYKDNTLDYRNKNCFTIFVHNLGTLGEKANQSCEYHIVPRPRK